MIHHRLASRVQKSHDKGDALPGARQITTPTVLQTPEETRLNLLHAKRL